MVELKVFSQNLEKKLKQLDNKLVELKENSDEAKQDFSRLISKYKEIKEEKLDLPNTLDKYANLLKDEEKITKKLIDVYSAINSLYHKNRKLLDRERRKILSRCNHIETKKNSAKKSRDQKLRKLQQQIDAVNTELKKITTNQDNTDTRQDFSEKIAKLKKEKSKLEQKYIEQEGNAAKSIELLKEELVHEKKQAESISRKRDEIKSYQSNHQKESSKIAKETGEVHADILASITGCRSEYFIYEKNKFLKLIRSHWQSSGSIFYLVICLIGGWSSFFYYKNRFGINVIDYANVADFFLVGMQSPCVIISAAITIVLLIVLTVFVSIQPNSWALQVVGEFIAKQKMAVILILILCAGYLSYLTTPIYKNFTSCGENSYRVQLANNWSIPAMENTVELVGMTTDFIFFSPLISEKDQSKEPEGQSENLVYQKLIVVPKNQMHFAVKNSKTDWRSQKEQPWSRALHDVHRLIENNSESISKLEAGNAAFLNRLVESFGQEAEKQSQGLMRIAHAVEEIETIQTKEPTSVAHTHENLKIAIQHGLNERNKLKGRKLSAVSDPFSFRPGAWEETLQGDTNTTDNLLEFLENCDNDCQLIVIGAASPDGVKDVNYGLSQKRANHVVQIIDTLIKKDDHYKLAHLKGKIELVNFGEQHCINGLADSRSAYVVCLKSRGKYGEQSQRLAVKKHDKGY